MNTTLRDDLFNAAKSKSTACKFIEYLDGCTSAYIPDEVINSPNQFYYIVKVTDFEILHVSPGVENITGYKEERFDKHRLIDNIHPEDSKIFIEASLASLDVIISLKKEKLDLTSIINFRWKRKNGTYAHFLKHTFLLESNNTEKLFYYKSIITDISDHKNDNRIMAKVFYKDVIISEINNYSISKTDILSKRELEVAKLIIENYSTQQISDKLFVSKHTIDTHRKNIVNKLGIKNTRELFSIMAME